MQKKNVILIIRVYITYRMEINSKNVESVKKKIVSALESEFEM